MARRARQAARREAADARPRRAVTPRPGRTLVLACGALAKDLLAIMTLNGWSHFDVRSLPAILHNHPDRICEALKERIDQARPAYDDRILIAYADCGTGGMLDRLCEREGLARIAGPHCYSFFSGNDAFAAGAEEDVTTFYLTDFLVDHFETLVIKELGLDRHPELREMYFGHYERLVYLAQGDDPARVTAAEKAAERLGLTFAHRPTGWGDLPAFLATASAP